MAVPPQASATLADLLARQLALRPRARALHFEGEDWSYAELAQRVDTAAGALWHAWGVRPGDRVAWLGLNHPGQLVLLFALARIGAALLPLNIRLAPAEWLPLMAGCTPVALVHDAAFADAARDLGRAAGLPVQAVDTLQSPAPQVGDSGRSEDVALLVYTSGTTAAPRAAVHTQANLLANMAIAAAVQGIAPGDVVLTVLPMFHVGGLCIQTLPALFAGAAVVLHPRFAPQATLAALEEHRPTLTLQVPATMKACIEHPGWAAAPLEMLRAVWAGSSLLPAPLVAAFHARGVPVCNVYGATETGPFSIALGPPQAFTHAGACGWPAPGVEVRLAPVEGRAATEGELWVRGPNVVARYWPDQPACDADGWFHTGDLAARAADGSYTVVGRAKDLIISGGENIHPAEIESPLAEHPDVLECAAFGVPDADWGEAVAVAVVLRPGAAVAEAGMREHLAGRLARYKQPRRWLWLEALPKTALGKVQRPVLAELLRRQT
jgi:fatty-acyl-CoA synthase